MSRAVPNFQLERMEGDNPVIRESFQKIQQFLCDPSGGLTGIINDLLFDFGLSWGRSGVNAPASFLLNDDVVSSTVGRVTPEVFNAISKISVAQATAVTSRFTVVEHDGGLVGQVDLVTVDMAGGKQRVFDFTGVEIAVSPGRQLGIRIDTTASDGEGTRLSEPYQFSFTTEPIRIWYTRPRHKETWVSPNSRISIIFNTDMDIESATLAFKMMDSQLKEVTGEFSWRNQRQIDFRPHSALAGNEEYTVTIDTTASDLRGAVER